MSKSSLEGLPDRIKQGLSSYAMQARRRGISQIDLGEAIAEAEGRATSYDAATVEGWIKGVEFPSFAAICAIGKMYLPRDIPQFETFLTALLYGDDAFLYGLNETDYRRYIGDVAPPPPRPPIGFR